MSQRGLMAVDIGNSAIKLGWFPPRAGDGHLVGRASLPQPEWTEQYPTAQTPPDSLLAKLSAETVSWHISSVHRDGAEQLQRWLVAHRPGDEIYLLTYRDLPIAVQVEAPERVGLDRLAAAVAADVLRDPTHAAIVVGTGSAVTVNLVSRAGAFEGGAILPGFRMQAEALSGADQLPLTALASDEKPPSLGKNTDQAIRSGLFWGTVGAVRELLAQLSAGQEGPVDVFVTGGDVSRLAGALGGNARFVPNMVLVGVAVAAELRQR